MAFFRGGGFDDPLFGEMHRMMRSHMRDLDSLLVDPFGMTGGGRTTDERRYRSPREQMIEDGPMESRGGRRDRHSVEERGSALVQRDPMSSLMDSFGFGFGSGLFGGLMRQMEQLQDQAINDPNGHVFTQSTVISMKPGEDGRPRYYEKTESVRKTGDVKETRRTLRDTERGVEKMEIGHHIGDRGHVIEKRRDKTTGGQILENQEFIGLGEDEAEQFDREWSHKTRRALSGERYFLDDDDHVGPHFAIEDTPSHSRRHDHRTFPYARSPIKKRKSKPCFRVEEPIENESQPKADKTSRRKGPKIVELE